METLKVTLDFHKSSEERPEKSCEVIVMERYKYGTSLGAVSYSKEHNLFNAHDGDYAGGAMYGREFGWWAYIPTECYRKESEKE